MKTILNKKPIMMLFLSLVFGLFLLADSSDSYAVSYAGRMNRYTYQSFTSTFVSIAPAYGGSGTFLISGDDGYSTIPMPFAYNYDSSSFAASSSLYVYCNGYAAFNNNSQYQYGTGYLGSTSYPSELFVSQGDLYVNTGIYYQTTGVVGSRVFTIEWCDTRAYSGNGKTTNFQLKLYEGTNVFEYLYRDYSFTLAGPTMSFGVNSRNVTPFYAFSFVTASQLTPPFNIRGVCPALPDQNLTSSPKVLDYLAQFTGTIVQKTVTIQNVGVINNLTFTSASIIGNPDYTIVSAPTPGSILIPGQTASIVVQFIAQQDGPRTGILSIVTNGLDSGTQTITLKGSGIAPIIAIDTNILFKKTAVPMGSSATKWLRITAQGQASLFFNSFPITGGDADQYTITYFPANPIAPGKTDSLGVTYTPTREGNRGGATLTINSNASNLPSIPVQLLGRATLPHIVVTPGKVLQFDSVGRGDTVCKSISVYNPGSDTLRLFANSVVSNDGDFVFTGLTGSDTAIPPDKTRLLNVCFIPKQAGLRQARIVLRTNIIPTFEQPRRDTAGVVLIDIAGTGVPFGVLSQSAGSITDSVIVGTQVCHNDTLWNKGDADITITSATVNSANPADISLGNLKLPFNIKAGGYAIVNVCATASQRGLNAATVTFSGKSNNRPLAAVSSINIKGLLVCATPAPSALFSQVKLYKGSDSTQCVTVTNCGDVATTYTAVVNGASAADYVVTPGSSQVIPAGGTADFCVKYNATAVGASPATLAITAPDVTPMSIGLGASAGCAVLTADAVAIPKINAGGHTTFKVHISNTGTYLWNPGTPVVTSATPGIFTYVGNGTITPLPETNGSTDLDFKYDPTSVNTTYSATITFPNSGPCEASALSIDLNQSTGTEGVRADVTSQNGYSLNQNHPNPFASSTTFSYITPNESSIKLSLRDLTGKLVQTVTEGRVSSGEHIVTLDANNLPSGTYLLILESAEAQLSRQIVIAK